MSNEITYSALSPTQPAPAGSNTTLSSAEDTIQSCRPLRLLLPQTSSRAPAFPPPEKHRRQPRITTACEPCREHKAKCSGERPICATCTKRGRKCYYVTKEKETRIQALRREMQAEKSPYEELVQAMKSMEEADAQTIFEKLRSGVDVQTLVKHIKSGDLLLQLAVTPETRFRYDFPYDKDMPDDLLTDDNDYLRSPMYGTANSGSSFVQCSIEGEFSQIGQASTVPSVLSHSPEVGSSSGESLYLKPFHAAKVVDARLSSVKISSWTNVCDDNELMQNILYRWLLCEYQFTAAFQKDLFLEDMVAMRDDFCSSLLVCCSQFSNRAEYWNPHTLTYRFIAEAKRLWELEAHVPRLTTIQAGILFNVYHNLCGLDEIGQAYRIHAITLAQNMRLFSSTETAAPRIRQGTAFTAWALFNWETLVGFSFMFPPLLREPPEWQLPDASKVADWYGEIWIKYPLNDRVFPSFFGLVFQARSRFRIIMNEACQTAYSRDTEMGFNEASTYLSRLQSWYDDLPRPLLPKLIVLPGHLQLHMYYHHLILTIFKPLLDITPNGVPSPPQTVLKAARYLQTLIRIYYLRHGYDAMDLFIVIPLMLAAQDCIEAMNQPTFEPQLKTLRSTLILVTMGLSAQRRNHYLAEALFRVVRGCMRPSEIDLCRGIVDMNTYHVSTKKDISQQVRSRWPVSIVKRKDDVDSYVLSNLVENYAHINVEEGSYG